MDTNYSYIVNCPVYNNIKNPENVDAEVSKILETCSDIVNKDRTVSVIIGLNLPEDAPVSEDQAQEAVRRVQALTKRFEKTALDIQVISYRWNRFVELLKPLDFHANERINYVSIRNLLFYSPENITAIRNCIEKAKDQNVASVKLLALDADTQLSEQQIKGLESVWNESTSANKNDIHLSPLITSMYYKFSFENYSTDLIRSDNSLNWGLFLAKIGVVA